MHEPSALARQITRNLGSTFWIANQKGYKCTLSGNTARVDRGRIRDISFLKPINAFQRLINGDVADIDVTEDRQLTGRKSRKAPRLETLPNLRQPASHEIVEILAVQINA